MLRIRNNERAFLELLKSGLWEQDVQLFPYEKVDFKEVFRIAQEQSVIGLVLQGIDRFMVHGSRFMVPQEVLLPWIGEVQMIEQRNKAMNMFVAELIERLRNEDIHALLVKGQGIAQCYERPLWRACGDIDLLLDAENYQKAKKLLMPLADEVETEYTFFKHVGMTLEGWTVELHGTLQTRLSKRIDDELDRIQNQLFKNDEVRTWHNGETEVFLPAPNQDVIFVFTHILHHFFIEGVGLRQICDWCRLLWIFRDEIDVPWLEQRLQKMGLMSEWKAFYNLASKYLGMPDYGSGLMVHDSQYDKKADRIMEFVLEVGNFGHNQKRNYEGKPYLIHKFLSFWIRLSDMLRHFKIFPKDSILFFGGVLRSGLYAAVRGE